MAEISTAEDWVSGDLVTDTRLDNVIGSAAILPTFITAKTELVTPTGTEFFNVIDSTGLYKKVQLSNIPGVGLANPAYVTLTDGATVTQTCAATKTCQNAKLLIGGNRSLVITGATSGMYGVILVTQNGPNNTLALPATSYGLGQTGPITTADLSLTSGVTTICAWTFDSGNYYWTFAKYAVASPLCRAYNTVVQSIPNTTATAITFDAETHDNDGMHSNVSQLTRVTVQRPGIYLAVLSTLWASNGTGDRYSSIYVNGSSIGSNRYVPTTTAGNGLSAVFPCSALDYFEAFVSQTSGAALNLAAGSNLTVTRIGAF